MLSIDISAGHQASFSMNQAFLKEMETELLNEDKRLRVELEEFAKQNPKNMDDYDTKFPNVGDKEDENAEEVDQFSTNLTLERTIESSLRDVEKALERLKKGTYGICKYCNKEIDEKRLRARPSSSSCIECKKKFTQEF
jgi:DnaK suppressor protein